MKKMIVCILTLTSASAFALDTNCKMSDKHSGKSKFISLKSEGPSTLHIDQELVEGLEKLNLTALSLSVENRIGGEVKTYGEFESFAVSFESHSTASDTAIRLKMNEDKTFELFVESWPEGKQLSSYEGKCKTKISKTEAKEMVEAIHDANRNL